jgi:hypothetical protein
VCVCACACVCARARACVCVCLLICHPPPILSLVELCTFHTALTALSSLCTRTRVAPSRPSALLRTSVRTHTVPAHSTQLHTLALKVFFDQLNIRANALLGDVEPPPPSLGPPGDLERMWRMHPSFVHCDVVVNRTMKQNNVPEPVSNCASDVVAQPSFVHCDVVVNSALCCAPSSSTAANGNPPLPPTSATWCDN